MTPETSSITVPERGYTYVDASVWSHLSGDPDFWGLVERGILTVSQASRSGIRLGGTRFVGTAYLAQVTVNVREKIPGALAALLRFATRGAFRVEDLSSAESELGELTALLVHQFVHGVKAYVSGGRDFRYGIESASSPLARGRLNVVRTIRLRARGMGHLIGFDRNLLDYRTPKNTVIFVALREIEAIGRVISLDQNDLAMARALSFFFSDCRSADIPTRGRMSWALLAEEIAATEGRVEDSELLALAAVLLGHRGFELEEPTGRLLPRTWFLDLEDLFEASVRQVLTSLVEDDVSVQTGADLRVRIFPASETYRAEPDIVIYPSGGPPWIGDVKYKDWAGGVVQPDVYQLLVHASAYQANECFLVFPSDTFSELDLGPSSVGPRVQLFAVDVRRMNEDLSLIMGRLGVPFAMTTDRDRIATGDAEAQSA